MDRMPRHINGSETYGAERFADRLEGTAALNG
jgi:hypothetical protein